MSQSLPALRNLSRATLLAAALTLLLTLLALLLPLPSIAHPPAEHHIDLDARSFAFEPARLRIHQGDRVTLTLRAEDVVHGLYLDGYNVNIVAEPGKPASATFVADRQGKFRYRCSVTCGNLHPFMIGELVVGPNLSFWRAAIALGIVACGVLVTLYVHQTTHPA